MAKRQKLSEAHKLASRETQARQREEMIAIHATREPAQQRLQEQLCVGHMHDGNHSLDQETIQYLQIRQELARAINVGPKHLEEYWRNRYPAVRRVCNGMEKV